MAPSDFVEVPHLWIRAEAAHVARSAEVLLAGTGQADDAVGVPRLPSAGPRSALLQRLALSFVLRAERLGTGHRGVAGWTPACAVAADSYRYGNGQRRK
jgi:hypothetical protein